MALPRLDYQAPDYAGQIGQALGGAAKTVNDWSPAPAIVQKYAKFVQSGQMSGREAAVRAMLESGGHLPSGGGTPDAGGGQASAGGYGTPSTPAGPSPAASFSQPQSDFGSAWRSMGKGGSEMVSQPRLPESTFPPEDITVTAPQGPQQTSPPPPELPDSAPILNKDVPALMQIGSQMQRRPEIQNYLDMLRLQQGQERLQQGATRITNQADQFSQLMPERQARMEATKAQTANIPFLNEQRKQNTAARWAGVGIGERNVTARENENYLRGTNDVATPLAQIKGLVSQAQAMPGIMPDSGDYRVRKEIEIVNSIYGGKPLGGLMKWAADSELTEQQRTFRRQAKMVVQPYATMVAGKQISGPEADLINMITGEQLAPVDTLAALGALGQIMEARLNRYKAGYPGAAARIPDVQPSAVTPKFYQDDVAPTDIPRGSAPQLPGPTDNVTLPRQRDSWYLPPVGGQ